MSHPERSLLPTLDGTVDKRGKELGMARRLAVASMVMGAVALMAGPSAAQIDAPAETAAFQGRVNQYVQMHRRLEGPLPPLKVTTDMDEVHRLMADLRRRIREERGRQAQGPLVTPPMALVLRQVIGTTLTVDDLIDLAAELDEHTPEGMPAPCVNEPLPEDAPRVMMAPQLLRALPPLPHELRYMALSKALIIWDHHADLVVEMVPGLFDPLTYSKKKTLEAHETRRLPRRE
jgi:hypothetical protein